MIKKIIFFANTSWFLFNFNLNLMMRLKELEYEVIAVSPEDSYSQRFSDYNIQFISVKIDNKGTNPIKDSLLIARLTLLFVKLNPTYILAFTPKCNIYGALVAGFLNIPIINNISGLGTAFININHITNIVLYLYKISLKKSSKVFLLNNDDYSYFIENNIIKTDQAELLPGTGVDIKTFSPLRRQSNNKKFIFLFVARMLKDKGIIELVEATRLLKIQYPNIECQLLGFMDAINSSAITQEQMQLWVDEGVVNYLGVSDCVVDYLRKSDCVVLPSYREGVPRSLLEAASVGKPIITTNAVGCREVVDDGINGFLCEPRNILDLKSKMEKMFLLSKEERIKLGLNGREKILNNFDEEIILAHYINTLNKLNQ